MVFNMLLIADSFALRGDTLILKSGDKVMIELIATKQDINVKMSKKSHGKKDKKEAKAKITKKKEPKSRKSEKQLTKKTQKKSSAKKHTT